MLGGEDKTETYRRLRRMSAYGAIKRSNSGPPPSTTWRLKSKRPDSPKSLTVHHVTLETAKQYPGLVDYLHRVFADELERGQTYPQEILPGEVYTREQFDAYYFAADVLVAVTALPAQDGAADPLDAEDGSQVTVGFGEVIGGRAWEECIAGCYYVSSLPFGPLVHRHVWTFHLGRL